MAPHDRRLGLIAVLVVGVGLLLTEGCKKSDNQQTSGIVTSPTGATYAIVSFVGGCSVPINSIVETRFFAIDGASGRYAYSGALLSSDEFPLNDFHKSRTKSAAYVAEIVSSSAKAGNGSHPAELAMSAFGCSRGEERFRMGDAHIVRLLRVADAQAARALLTEARDRGLPSTSSPHFEEVVGTSVL